VSPLTILATALSSLGTNKLRTGLALLGIVIGVAAVISIMSVGRGAQRDITSNIESLGANLIFVHPSQTPDGSVGTLTLQDAYALLDPVAAPAVARVAPELSTSAELVAGKENTFSQVLGVTPDYGAVRNYSVASGRFISPLHVQNVSDVAVVGSQLAEDLYGFRDPVGQTLRIGGRRFTVIGVLEGQGGNNPFDDYRVMVPITTVYFRLESQRTVQGDITVETINVQAAEGAAIDDAIRQVTATLRLRHRITGEDDFIVNSLEETIQAVQEATETFVIFLGAVAGISLLVGGISIMNIMLVSVTERTREIGIRKAMGAKRRDILLQFVSEATLLSFGGSIVGAIAGLAISKALNGLDLGGAGEEGFRTVVTGDIVAMAMAVAVAIGLFFGIYPAARAANLHPIEALRYE
jgi:putative ABC transport system permease protein